MKIKPFIVFAIYLNVFAVGVSLWKHSLGWAIANSSCVLWNLFSLELIDKQEEKDRAISKI